MIARIKYFIAVYGDSAEFDIKISLESEVLHNEDTVGDSTSSMPFVVIEHYVGTHVELDSRFCPSLWRRVLVSVSATEK